jgi:sulfide:quinone oxidoreductase
MHEHLKAKGIRDRSSISLVMPLGTPVPPSPAASAELLRRFANLGIAWYPDRLVRSLDADRHVALVGDGDGDGDGELPCDLFLGIPVHRAPTVVEESGLTVDGWIPVDALTLETRFPGVYAVGDVASVGTPKAGVFAEGQAAVVADRITAIVRGEPEAARYDGRGVCYVEFGEDGVARVDVTFASGQQPTGGFDGPSLDLAADKVEFGTSRVRRWFG